MNTKTKTGVALMATVFALILTPIVFNEAEARITPTPMVFGEADATRAHPTSILQGDLTAPNGDKSFGGDVIGSYYSHVVGDFTTISVKVNIQASLDSVYEGWLVDADTGEKTSLGIFQEYRGAQLLTSIENQFNNDLIVITESPLAEPSTQTTIGGAVLANPFGQ